MALQIKGGKFNNMANKFEAVSPDARRIQIAKRNRLMELLNDAHDMAMATGQDQAFVNTLERLHNQVSRNAPMFS